jgi:NAD(P) transhydrogenase
MSPSSVRHYESPEPNRGDGAHANAGASTHLCGGRRCWPPALASASYDQGRFVGRQIRPAGTDDKLIQSVPTGIYTSPEISSLGKTEKELTDAKVPYEVGRAMFRSIARAQIDGQPVGMLKLLFHTETLEILGLHCFGAQASEIIHIGQAIMNQPAPNNSIQYFVDSTRPWPKPIESRR